MDTAEIHKLTKSCVQCHKEFRVRSPSEMATRMYCSNKCRHDADKKQKILLLCEVCGKEMWVSPCFNTPERKRRYCSDECRSIGHRKFQDLSVRQCNQCNNVLSVRDDFGKGEYICKKCRNKMSNVRARTPHGRFTQAKHIAKRRGMEWSIPENIYCDLIDKSCHYCGGVINETGAGLDRKDNSRGYTPDNVVPCCNSCNLTKSHIYSYDEMLLLAVTIREIKDRRRQDL